MRSLKCISIRVRVRGPQVADPARGPDHADRRDDLLTATELAERLRVKPSTVLDWQRSGRIPSIRLSHKILRFNLGDVVAALKPDAGKGLKKARRDSERCQRPPAGRVDNDTSPPTPARRGRSWPPQTG